MTREKNSENDAKKRSLITKDFKNNSLLRDTKPLASKFITAPKWFGSASKAQFANTGSTVKAKAENESEHKVKHTYELSVPPKAFLNNGTAAENIAAVEAYIAESDAKIFYSELCENPYKEIFYDKDGNIVKTNFLCDKDGQRQVWNTGIEFDLPRQNGVISVSRSNHQIEVKVTQPVVETFEGSKMYDKGYKEFDLYGNLKREVFASNGAYVRIPDNYEIRYKDGMQISVKQEVFAKDGAKIITVIDYIKNTKRVEKSDKNRKTYEISETGINDEPEFITKQDIIKSSDDVWVKFPDIRQAVTNSDFDCNATQIIVETLRKQPYICQKIIKLKNADGTLRFTPEETAALIFNCRNFIDTPRFMKFLTTQTADGNKRKIYQIWRGYVDSDEFKDVSDIPDEAPKADPVEAKVIEAMRKPEMTKYIEKIIATNGNSEALYALLREIQALDESHINKALAGGITKCILGFGKNTEYVADFIKTELTRIIAEAEAMASVNSDAVLSDEVYASAFELSHNLSASEKRHVAELMKSKAGIVEKLMTYKNSDGSQMFTPRTVAEFFLNCETVIETAPGRIFTTIESDSFQKNYADWENKSIALWKCLYG